MFEHIKDMATEAETQKELVFVNYMVSLAYHHKFISYIQFIEIYDIYVERWDTVHETIAIRN